MSAEAAEAEAEAKMSPVKDDKKQFAYDSEGNVILVQPPNVQRLPNPNTMPSYVCKQARVSETSRMGLKYTRIILKSYRQI